VELNRRFWEDDYPIYGGHSFTDQAIGLVSNPNYNFFKDGRSCCSAPLPTGQGAISSPG